MSPTPQTAKKIAGKQLRFLRGQGHKLDASIIIGKEGISGPLLDSLMANLSAHELIKIKLGPNCPLPRQAVAQQLASQVHATLVQLLGKTILLYRPNPKLRNDKRISLPGGAR